MELISSAKDLVVALAAAMTAFAAFQGLKSWKTELRGRTNFEAARLLIKSTYILRDKLQDSRGPFIATNEFPSDYSPMQENTAEIEGKAYNHLYRNRLKPVRKAIQTYETHALEAEVLWGPSMRKKTDVLRQCVREVEVAMESIVRDKFEKGRNFETDKEFGIDSRNIAEASRLDKKNEMNKKIWNAVRGIEDMLIPHLRRD